MKLPIRIDDCIVVTSRSGRKIRSSETPSFFFDGVECFWRSSQTGLSATFANPEMSSAGRIPIQNIARQARSPYGFSSGRRR